MSLNKNAQTKNKSHKALEFDFDLGRLTGSLGFVAMSAAAVLSLIEVEYFKQERLAVMQPAYVTINESTPEQSRGAELFRRGEKEESPHSMVSYGTTMRSHATAGRR